ncbi:MAG: DUF4338 domain-containing protein [Deltaproteobacteria bacterium]|nr:DUF4338 domain-containing protein [Deltaproteobacteria bacterium]
MPDERPWRPLRPTLPPGAAARWTALCEAIVGAQGDAAALARLREALPEALGVLPEADRPALRAAALVALDLSQQGWEARLDAGLHLRSPAHDTDPQVQKARTRARLLIQRDRQLQEPATQAFLRRMEARAPHGGGWRSVRDLTRDGAALAARLREAIGAPDAAERLAEVIQPRLELVEETRRCAHTGLLLRDIWRYFRHTWSTPYRSVPGRGMAWLVRDAAAPNEPIIGLLALVSPPAQISARDRWLGWEPDAVVARLRHAPTDALARWLVGELARARAELFVQDLIEDGVISPSALRAPDEEALARLRAEARRARAVHGRFARPTTPDADPEATDWEARARSPLFRAKRALLLAALLEAARGLGPGLLRAPSAATLAEALSRPEGARAARILARRAKADRMGAQLAELGVCGALPPYSALLGGKLVAMLAASPEVQAAYAARYGGAASLIASSMAGRPVTRDARLFAITTSSLYGRATAQYARLSAPAEALGGPAGARLTYRDLGLTLGYGTAHLSEEAAEALTRLAEQRAGGQRASSLLGEGVSPKLRKLRGGLEALGFPADALLLHGGHRRVYGLALVARPQDAALGLDPDQEPLIPQDEPRAGTERIVAWWRARWLVGRVGRSGVLERHGGRMGEAG